MPGRGQGVDPLSRVRRGRPRDSSSALRVEEQGIDEPLGEERKRVAASNADLQIAFGPSIAQRHDPHVHVRAVPPGDVGGNHAHADVGLDHPAQRLEVADPDPRIHGGIQRLGFLREEMEQSGTVTQADVIEAERLARTHLLPLGEDMPTRCRSTRRSSRYGSVTSSFVTDASRDDADLGGTVADGTDDRRAVLLDQIDADVRMRCEERPQHGRQELRHRARIGTQPNVAPDALRVSRKSSCSC